MTEPSIPPALRRRLSVLMFLQYAPAGAVIPIFSLRLQELDFEPAEMGWACATQSLGTLAAPLVAGQIADRWWPAERVLAWYAVLSGLLLWLLATLTTPATVFLAALTLWSLFAPAMSLGVALSFAHLPNPARDFARVRLWGTLGWIVVGWLAGQWLDHGGCLSPMLGLGDRPPELADTFRIGGIFAFILGAYALTLPHTPPQRQLIRNFAPLTAIRALRTRALIVYAVCVVGVSITIPFYSQVTPLYLQDQGIPTKWIGSLLTLSQSTEIVTLAILPMLLTRLGIKGTLGFGIAACATAFVVMFIGHPLGLVIGSLTMHGLYICCFFVAGQVFVNSHSPNDVRASANALVSFLIGAGMLVGHVTVGWVRDLVDKAYRPTFAVSAMLALALFAGFLLTFPADDRE